MDSGQNKCHGPEPAAQPLEQVREAVRLPAAPPGAAAATTSPCPRAPPRRRQIPPEDATTARRNAAQTAGRPDPHASPRRGTPASRPRRRRGRAGCGVRAPHRVPLPPPQPRPGPGRRGRHPTGRRRALRCRATTTSPAALLSPPPGAAPSQPGSALSGSAPSAGRALPYRSSPGSLTAHEPARAERAPWHGPAGKGRRRRTRRPAGAGTVQGACGRHPWGRHRP